MRKEDECLRKYMEKGRLSDWWSGVVDAAQKSLKDEAERAVATAKRRREIEEELEGV